MTIRQVVKHYGEKITFGKYKGKTFQWILYNEPSYLLWLDMEEIVDMPEDLVKAAVKQNKEQNLIQNHIPDISDAWNGAYDDLEE